MQGPNSVLNIITVPPGASSTQPRIVIDGTRGAIFEYAAGGPLGALVSSWASTAGTDPYGNVYPAGFSAGAGSQFVGTNFVINSVGEFRWSGTPAAGNLIYSDVSVAGNDGHGNLTLAGVTSYNGNVNGSVAVNLSAGSFTLWEMISGAWVQQTSIGYNPISNTWQFSSAGASPAGVVFNNTLEIAQYLQLDGIATPAASSQTRIWTDTTSGAVHSIAPSGFTGAFDRSTVDISTHAVGNVATAGDITKTWTVPINDFHQNDKYELETYVYVSSGATTAETLTLGIDLDGTNNAIATLGATFNGSALSTNYSGLFRLLLLPSSGGGVIECTLDGTLGDTSANRLATNSVVMSGSANSLTFGTGVAHTIALYAVWGGAGGAGQNVQTLSSTFRKVF